MRIGRATLLTSILSLGLFAATASAVPVTNVKTTVGIEGYTYNSGTDTVTFKGPLISSEKCTKGRTVTLRQIEDNVKAGTDTTAASGSWKIHFTGADVNEGEFVAIAAKRVIKKRRNGEVVRKTVCQRDVSPVFDAT